jgi:DNA repair protein RadC
MKAKEGAVAQDFQYVELVPRALLPLIEETAQAIEQLQDIKAERKEYFVGLYLNARHELLHEEIISIGTVNASIVHSRDVFSPAIMH